MGPHVHGVADSAAGNIRYGCAAGDGFEVRKRVQLLFQLLVSALLFPGSNRVRVLVFALKCDFSVIPTVGTRHFQRLGWSAGLFRVCDKSVMG